MKEDKPQTTSPNKVKGLSEVNVGLVLVAAKFYIFF